MDEIKRKPGRPKTKIQVVQERLQFNEQKNQEELKPVASPVPTHVEIDTKGEIVEVNGHRFAGKCKVPREYVSTVKRIILERQYQASKNKQGVDHPDKRAILHGGR